MTPNTRDLLGAVMVSGTTKVSKIANRVTEVDDITLLASVSRTFEASFRAARRLAWIEAKEEFKNLGLPQPKLKDISIKFLYGNVVIGHAAANISRARAQLIAGGDKESILRDLKKRLAAGITAAITRAYNQALLELYSSVEAQLGVTVRKKWNSIKDDRTCKLCQIMDGQTAGLFDSFQVPVTARVFFDFVLPPAHPVCRCWISYEIS